MAPHNLQPARTHHVVHVCVAFTAAVAGVLFATASWSQASPQSTSQVDLPSQSQSVPQPAPLIELQARSVDAIDVLAMLSRLDHRDFVAVRDQRSNRIDFPRHVATMSDLRRDIVARSGLKQLQRNGTEIVVSPCRRPLPTVPDIAVDHEKPVGLFFNQITPREYFPLMARILSLELSVPDGLPTEALSLVIWNQRPSEIISMVDSVLFVETRIVGDHLVVRKPAEPRPCSTDGSGSWQSLVPPPDALNVSLDVLLRFIALRSEKTCKRASAYPETAERSCRYLEQFALKELPVRGYIKLTRNSPYGLIVEPPLGSFLERAYPGERLGEQFGVIKDVNSRQAEIVERSRQEPAGVQEMLTRISFKTGASQSGPADPLDADAAHRLTPHQFDLEVYDLEDLSIRTQEVKGAWQATVTDPFGIDHVVHVNNYLGANDGKITRITDTEIQLEEIVPDGLGGYVEKNTVLVPGQRYADARRALLRRYAAPVSGAQVQEQFVDAAARGDTHRLQQLVQLGADLDAVDGYEQNNALVDAIYSRKPDTVAWLLANGARADVLVGRWEETPLHAAASLGDPGVVQQLLAAHADVNLRDRYNRTPIVHALAENHGSVVALLVANGADIKTPDSLGLTPFTRAAYYAEADVVRLFMSHGVTIADRDANGYTLLSAAVRGGGRELVAMLIEQGSDVNAISKQGESLLDVARGKQMNPAIVELLISKGARSAKATSGAK
jgi:ankyrin repeat protein/Tfp pilus assembly protein PilP